jgi:hypothetical protein
VVDRVIGIDRFIHPGRVGQYIDRCTERAEGIERGQEIVAPTLDDEIGVRNIEGHRISLVGDL